MRNSETEVIINDALTELIKALVPNALPEQLPQKELRQIGRKLVRDLESHYLDTEEKFLDDDTITKEGRKQEIKQRKEELEKYVGFMQKPKNNVAQA